MNFRMYEKKVKITGIITVLLCLIFSVSACGTGKKAEAEETDGDSSQVQDFAESVSQENIEEAMVENMNGQNTYTLSSTVEDVVNAPCFGDFGRLLFPVDRSVSEDMTLEEISSSSVYVWYNYIAPDKTVENVQYLHDHAAAEEQVFYDIYTEKEKEADSSKEDTVMYVSAPVTA